MGKFGWSLPPGVSPGMLPGEQSETCMICYKDCADCICPECPKCGEVGRLECYGPNGLKPTKEQLISHQQALVSQLEAKLREEKMHLNAMQKMSNPFNKRAGWDDGEPYLFWDEDPNKWEDPSKILLTWG